MLKDWTVTDLRLNPSYTLYYTHWTRLLTTGLLPLLYLLLVNLQIYKRVRTSPRGVRALVTSTVTSTFRSTFKSTASSNVSQDVTVQQQGDLARQQVSKAGIARINRSWEGKF